MTVTDTPIAEREHVVYRLFAEDGELLYVGMTASLPARLAQHRADKPWWDRVAKVTEERHPSKAAAAPVEKQAIMSESPTMNKIRWGPAKRTPLHVFRCSDALYDAAMATARRRRETLSDVVRDALKEFTRDPDRFVALHPPEPARSPSPIDAIDPDKWVDEHPKEDA